MDERDAQMARQCANDIINADPEKQKALLDIHHRAIRTLELDRRDAETALAALDRSLAMRHLILSLVEEARL